MDKKWRSLVTTLGPESSAAHNVSGTGQGATGRLTGAAPLGLQIRTAQFPP